jgi:hypothetical protein
MKLLWIVVLVALAALGAILFTAFRTGGEMESVSRE